MTRLAWLLLGILFGAVLVVAALDEGWISEASVHRGLRPYAFQLEQAPSRPNPDKAIVASTTPGSAIRPAAPIQRLTSPVTPPAHEEVLAGQFDPPPGDAPASQFDPPPASAPAGQFDPTPVLPPGPGLLMPVRGVLPNQLSDTYTQSRGAGRQHDAIDIIAPRGTPVLAVADGRIAKLFDSKPGGLTVYQFDPDEKLAYYYAHLDAYAPELVEGKLVHRGELIGFVGSTGNANPETPHLHFAVFVLGAEKRWWQGTPVNPYPLLRGE